MLIHLIRHAHAGSRTRWEEDDDLRPLSPKGEKQAEIVGRSLTDQGIDALWTSRSLRCRQTLAPLGRALGLELVEIDDLYEGASGGAALDVLLEGAQSGLTIAACSHGDVIPALVRAAVMRGAELHGSDFAAKSARYELRVQGEQVTDLVHVPAPDLPA